MIRDLNLRNIQTYEGTGAIDRQASARLNMYVKSKYH